MKYKIRKKAKSQKYKGFTLIELLVVVAIIAILSSVVMISLSGVQKKARGHEIQTEISNMSATYDTYKSSHFGTSSTRLSSLDLSTTSTVNPAWAAFWTGVIGSSVAPVPPKASTGVVYGLKTDAAGNAVLYATGPSGSDLAGVLTGNNTYWASKGGQSFENNDQPSPTPSAPDSGYTPPYVPPTSNPAPYVPPTSDPDPYIPPVTQSSQSHRGWF